MKFPVIEMTIRLLLKNGIAFFDDQNIR